MYVSAAGQSALPNHTDAHDVLVVHLHGSKQWRVCEHGAAGFGTRVNLWHNCAPLCDAEMQQLLCHNYSLRPGDLLFVPAGHAHNAIASPGGSAHLTLGVEATIARRAVSRAACTLLWPPALARVLFIALTVAAFVIGIDCWCRGRPGVRRGHPKKTE